MDWSRSNAVHISTQSRKSFAPYKSIRDFKGLLLALASGVLHPPRQVGLVTIQVEAPKTLADKKKAAEAAIVGIEKDHGKGSIFNMASKSTVPWPSRPTGIVSVDDDVLGIGGLPVGRIVEIYGPESGGKTTLTLQTIAETQKADELAAFIDAEHALDPRWAGKMGVDMKSLYISQPDNGEQALAIVAALLESNAFGIIVVDSVAALVPKAELEGDFGDSNMGLQARLMSQAMRKLTALVKNSKTTLVFINQIREKIGVMFGSPETTTGGRALKFYASVRLDVRRIAAVKEGEKVIGNLVRVKAAKNKLSPPFTEAEVQLLFDRGFDKVGSYLDAAVNLGVVEKSGTWFSFAGERLGQGKANAVELVTTTPELLEKIKTAIKGKKAA